MRRAVMTRKSAMTMMMAVALVKVAKVAVMMGRAEMTMMRRAVMTRKSAMTMMKAVALVKVVKLALEIIMRVGTVTMMRREALGAIMMVKAVVLEKVAENAHPNLKKS